MDGMFYRREGESRFDQPEPAASVAKLLLITVVVAVAILALMLFLSWAGFNLAVPSEFPSIAAEAG
jgi:hypothetical protein